MNPKPERRAGTIIKWVVPLLAGFAAVVLVTAVYRKLHPNYPKYILALASRTGLSPGECVEVEQARGRAGTAQFTADDWKLLKSLQSSPNGDQQALALGAMGQLYKSNYRNEAARLAEASAKSANGYAKAMSIGTLAHLHDPLWRDLAMQNRDSPDELVKHMCKLLLEREDNFK